MSNSGTIMDYFGDLFDPYNIIKSVQNTDVDASRSGAVTVVEHEDGSCTVRYVEGNGLKHLVGCSSFRQLNGKFSIDDFEWEMQSNADYANLDDKEEAIAAAKEYMAKLGPAVGKMYRSVLKSFSGDNEYCLLYAQTEGAIWPETVMLALDRVAKQVESATNEQGNEK